MAAATAAAATTVAAAASAARQMYPAVCAQCGKDTKVPFQPRGDKPVYCSDCFRSQPGGSSYGSDRSGSSRY